MKVPEKNRPNPDQLLRTIQDNEMKQTRGQLRVFFGMCPGVGKTYAMLKAAREEVHKGVDVVVGVVETHQRRDTEELLIDLKVIPRKKETYKGNVLEEMDIDEILRLHPSVVLVDELAHTNTPNSRHSKRYQDVEELLNAGIDVFTTVNVQHIESRADLVQQITGTVVRETVPDSILELASQIELIDTPPKELLNRLKAGKVYLGDRAEHAAQNFFKEEHLTALRELALRFTAEKVDSELKNQMSLKQIIGPWNTKERLLVAISHSPHSERMIRVTRRLAFNLGAPWIALYVDTGEKLEANDYETLTKNLNLAKELGAEVRTTQDSNIPDAVKRSAKENNVTQIVMGRPDRRPWRDLFSGGTLVDQVVRIIGSIDVHIVGKDENANLPGQTLRSVRWRIPVIESGLVPYWYSLWFMVCLSFGCAAALPVVGYRAIGFIFLMAVVGVSTVSTLGPTLFVATYSVLTWDYFFIPPRFTFVISETEDVLLCFIFFIVAITSGFLTTQIRKQRKDLLQREFRANLLYDLIRKISETQGSQKIGEIVSRCVEKLFDANTMIYVGQAPSSLQPLPRIYYQRSPNEKDLAVAIWSMSNRKKAGWSTDTLSHSDWLCIPLVGQRQPIGVFLFNPQNRVALSIDQENLLDTIVQHLAVAIEREQLEIQVGNARLLEESEKLHQALLNSVSHEIRTPLTSILGAATALQDAKTYQDQAARNALLENLIDSGERLNRVVENLLDMTRVEGGMLRLKSEFFEINEFIHSIVQHLYRLLEKHRVNFIRLPEEAFVSGDCRLLEHAISNIFLNAAHYSPAGSQIEVAITRHDHKICLEVKDEGTGIPEDAVDKIFQKFYRVPGTPAGGVGLGLSIVKSIMEAHGGSVAAKNRTDRSGLIVSVTLPVAELLPTIGDRETT